MLLDRQRVRDLLDRAKRTLSGDWLLVGGAFIALTVDERRTTEDIDLIALSDSNAQRHSLMQLAADIGIPVEAVNTAADFFVRKIPGWRDELDVLETGDQCTIFGPSPTLLVLLKLGRLSELDFEDCAHTIAAHPARIDRARVESAIGQELTRAAGDRKSRLEALQRLLGSK